jgi:hypothetical protein
LRNIDSDRHSKFKLPKTARKPALTPVLCKRADVSAAHALDSCGQDKGNVDKLFGAIGEPLKGASSTENRGGEFGIVESLMAVKYGNSI